MDPQAAPRLGALNNFNSLTGGRTRSFASKAFGALDTRSGTRSAPDRATDFGSQQSISAPDRTTDRASDLAQMVASKAFGRFRHPIQLRSAPDRPTDLVASKAFRHPIGHPIASDSVASKAFGASSCAQEGSQRSISAPDRTPDRAELVASKADRHPIGHPIAPDSVASKAFLVSKFRLRGTSFLFTYKWKFYSLEQSPPPLMTGAKNS